MEFFGSGVAGQTDDIHAVQKGSGDGFRDIGGRDEHDGTEVIVHFEIMIVEGVVLLGVEDLEQSGGGIAPEVISELVDFIEHEDGVGAPGLLQTLNDASGKRADVGAAVSADFRLVADAAEGHADKLAAHGFGDGLAEGGLADSRRSDETDDRGLAVVLELEDGKEFQNALLDVLETVVVAVEKPGGLADVETVLCEIVPRDGEEPVDVGVCDVVFGGRLRDHVETFKLLFEDFGDFLGQFELAHALLNVLNVGIAVALAELLLDGAELFTEEELALGFAHGVVDLRLDFRTEPEYFHLAIEEDGQQMEPFLKLGKGQDGKFLKIADVDRVGDQVHDAGVVREVEDGDFELLGEVRREGNDFLKLLHGVADHGDRFDAVVRGLGETFHAHFGSFVLQRLNEADAGKAAHEDAHGAVGEPQGFDEAAEHARWRKPSFHRGRIRRH